MKKNDNFKTKNTILQEILREIQQEKKKRCTFPFWNNWMNWMNWRNWINWNNWGNWINW